MKIMAVLNKIQIFIWTCASGIYFIMAILASLFDWIVPYEIMAPTFLFVSSITFCLLAWSLSDNADDNKKEPTK